MLSLWKPLSAERDLEWMLRDFAFPGFARSAAPAAYPAADVVETKSGIEIRLDMPGLDAKDIHVNVDNGVLTVSAERKLAREEKDERRHRSEVAYGVVRRSFTLSTKLDASHIAAKYENGVLTLTLPKREEAKPRQIEVKAA
jgi:HSP20 family protein